MKIFECSKYIGYFLFYKAEKYHYRAIFENDYPQSHDSAPKGQKPIVQGIALGFVVNVFFALKGQKHYLILGLLPLQGELPNFCVPRALP